MQVLALILSGALVLPVPAPAAQREAASTMPVPPSSQGFVCDVQPGIDVTGEGSLTRRRDDLAG
jgi:hypothetical protein